MNDGGDPVLKALVERLAAKTLRAVTLLVGEDPPDLYSARPEETPRVGDEAEAKVRRKQRAEDCYRETINIEANDPEDFYRKLADRAKADARVGSGLPNLTEKCAGCDAESDEPCALDCVSKRRPMSEEITAPGEKGCEHINVKISSDGTFTCEECGASVKTTVAEVPLDPAPEVVELFELTPALKEAIRELRRLQAEGHGGSCTCHPCIIARAPLIEAECLDIVYTRDPV